MEEIYILSPNGNICGIESREYVHNNGLLHPSVQCWVMNENGEVLIQRRAKTKKESVGKWDVSFGGHCTPFPSDKNYLIENVVKEGKEELGLHLTADSLIKLGEVRYCSKSGKNKELIAVFLTHTPKETSFVFEDAEVSEVKWINLNELHRNIVDRPNEYANRLKAVLLLEFYQSENNHCAPL